MYYWVHCVSPDRHPKHKSLLEGRSCIVFILFFSLTFAFYTNIASASVVSSKHDFKLFPEVAPLGTCSGCHYIYSRNQMFWRNLTEETAYYTQTNKPNYISPYTIYCYDCHDDHNTVDDQPPRAAFGLNPPQDIAFDDGPGGKTGYYETDPPGSTPPTDGSTTGGHYIKSNPPDLLQIERGDKIPCSDCHNPHNPQPTTNDRSSPAFNEVFLKPILGGKNIAGMKASHNTRSWNGIATGREICTNCHSHSDSGNPVTFRDVNIAYNSTTPIPKPPSSVGDHSILSSAPCTDCHVHNRIAASCSACHGQPPGGAIAPNRDGSHSAHFSAASGPGITECSACHPTAPNHTDRQATFKDGLPLSTTNACDPCHSKGGAFDGVNDPAIGAKASWYTGVYSAGELQTGKEKWCAGCHDAGTSLINGVSAPNVAGNNTTYGYFATGHGKNGKVKCTDCHDPDAVHADGNARTYEVNSSGVVHPYKESYRLKTGLDIPRPSTSVQEPEPWRYALCFGCHDSNRLLGDPLLGTSSAFYRANYSTDFRHDQLGYGSWGHGGRGTVMPYRTNNTSITYTSWTESTGRGSPGTERAYVMPDLTKPHFIYKVRYPEQWWPWFYQQPVEVVPVSTMLYDNPALWNGSQTSYAFGLPNNHYFHLANIGSWWDWDSDWDGTFNENGYESTRSCPTCHNVHGSTFPHMIRDGKLENKTGLQFSADPAYPNEGSYIIPYGSGTCEALCHNQWNGSAFIPRKIYWYRESLRTLHPSGLNSQNASWPWTVYPASSNWTTVLDRNDGDTSYVSRAAGGSVQVWFYVDMDDPAVPAGMTIQSVKIYAVARRTSTSPSINIDLGYKTGAATVWKYSNTINTTYTIISAGPYTTDSDGGTLELADINNLQIAVQRPGSGTNTVRVTEVYAEITYIPI